MKLWGGRFSKETDSLVDDFNSSIRFDARMYRQDIEGSIAHATMLGKQEIIPYENSVLIVKTLNEILADIEDGKVEFSVDAEDIHMNIEKLLIERIGDVGKQLHTGRSRNDQVALDLRLYLREQCDEICDMLMELTKTLKALASKNISVIMPGYTHLQKAQPILFSHHLLAYLEMYKRDVSRLRECRERLNISPLGSGALAGTTYPLDREYVAEMLNMDGVTVNSLDGVSDRDFAIEVCFVMSVIMMHTSRFAEEIILWSSNEFGFVELDDAFSTGSSIMPQKKNPDVAELARGKTGRVYGDLIALLTVMKGLPLAYNKDMQEDKEQVFDAIDTVKMTLPVFTKMLDTMTVNSEKMRSAALKGFTNATDAADYLVKKGMPFRDAHKVIGEIVAYCIKNNKAIEEMSIGEFKSFSELFENDIYEAVSLENCVDLRDVTGGTATNQVKQQL
ncbi:MAG: argininosuccinate lyase [Clostridia bacterium]|nr:argininosuccinate lyase [Clostridia bacterium]MBQ9997875.1 argininosuccinate lyase [Clostridia bacterium]